jgi:hypothetical protein
LGSHRRQRHINIMLCRGLLVTETWRKYTKLERSFHFCGELTANKGEQIHQSRQEMILYKDLREEPK